MEYEAAGITFDPGQVRVARLKEAVHVLKGLFGEGDFEFRGSHYQVKGLAERPLPLQQPHPPFMIGGGSAAVLGFAAQNAQIVGLAPRVLPDGRPDVIGCTLAGTRKKVEIIREAAGSRLAGLEINTYPSLGARVTDSRSALSEVRERVGRRSGVELSDQDLLESPHVFIGTIDSLAEKFQMLRETLGINNFFVGDDFRAFAPLVARFS
jgi:alkanesulfonate monooxygenase SsuD/methylene tetrahydromethanopterin reductase-like flavin-dependent oxidoreductase (luciferase family)